MSVHDFMVGVKRTALEPGELITAVTVPLLDGWQGYSKVGVRNAMVIATASACLAVHTPARSVRVALGSVGPTIIRATEAESFAAAAVDWDRGAISDDDARQFGELAGGRQPADRRPPLDRGVPPARDRCDGDPPAPARVPGGPVVNEQYTLHVNGADRAVSDAWLGENLLYVLRERLGLMAAKGACEQGECGSCSVLVDDRLVCSCLVLGGELLSGAGSSPSRGSPSPARRATCSRRSSTPVPCSAGSARRA